ncbi:MAG: transglycosylase SLT domain-containing protein [Ignavibacteriae bacterium]|nr:transglycosylase SLT domain-containing protein [Ignavibacteriota bacterium]
MEGLNLKTTQPKVHFDKPLEVESKYTKEEKAKLAKASKDFESVLTGMMVKSMTKTTEGMFGKDNYGGDVLDVLFEREMANHITESKGMGVAEKIFKSISGEELSAFEKEINKVKTNISFKNNEVKEIITKKLSHNDRALERLSKYDSFINSASEKYGVDENLIKSVILTESAAKNNAKSNASAKGLMQLMDSTATELGVENVWDAKDNIMGGTKYLSKLLERYDGDTDMALAGYNAGPGNVKKYNGIPPFKETQNYIKRVNNYLNNLD